ncbi:bifunctional diaminohydroxyphosphoribosylaminopyrimidine deaminase/5-amino-6-(5-phosphoribosylamino)uracil reductase RibD [Winogradskyella sp.]|uniref:bifunctional diaminohydroxyphosphoribosylaminopyrimidine deaminase/5-amino-6-(5-phosphoribosylamino)uracil reductase RibD n=1 Tax=Winogradskyella sp. TaxID=1883156 RepID=UPI0025E0CEEC|nr:bifunctional diaminohydroxyphosphoribosylaminopyrimidine deaminase/5-amino-6-(5-phosphoribosylamino)uracil reductase RibD [Winogradskyella sp.]MCT4628665.1 bifunctional diaminohydroxyphosphoribosylaminopyrimidine deaminase/5-amino-6-(5-phosphoribosylamino)uracil reductase RibD [Winogradskyella sp.]
MNTNEYYIKRCLQIAKNGLGSTQPNPMVGAVIVHKNNIIGEGYTSPYGGPHAEVNAINAVKDKTLLSKSTLYVTLEPCSHFGKTPPCSDLIVKHKIPKVVIGCVDDNPEVAGKGITKLKNSGCHVIVGVLGKECKTHHKRFFTFHNKKRPYIILKWAETRDGFIAPKSKDKQKPVWITNKYSRQLVHKWRAEEQSILVGINTVIEDNPSLTVRDWTGKHPVRIVLDKKKSLSSSLNVFNNITETIRITNSHIDFNQPIATQICKLLHKKSINSVIIEGGAKTLQAFINENLWDEARIFTGNAEFNNGIKAPKLNGTLNFETSILDDILRIYTRED